MTFALDIEKFSKDAGLEINLVVRKISLDAYTRVTKKTPVDTGRARANWNLSVGNIDDTTTQSVMQKSPMLPKNTGLTKAIYITNSLPYINALEHGHSTQAPPPRAIVGRTMNEIELGMSKYVMGK
jgi:hypothetical protein